MTTFMLTLSGDAVRGSDYTLSCNTAAGVTCNLSGDSPSITVTPSQLANVRGIDRLLNVTAIADDTKEDPETVTLSLGSRFTASFKIVDAPNKTSVRFAVATTTGIERGGLAGNPRPAIIVDPPFGSAIDINFMVSGTATAGVDYTAIAMPLTIPAGTDAIDEFAINIIDDALVEGDETIILTLHDLPDSVSAGDPSTVTIVIGDNDTPPVITSADAESVAENTTNVLEVETDNTLLIQTNYFISGGADSARFSIGLTSGALTFKTAPDFEMPEDQGTDNEYLVEVRAELLVNISRDTREVNSSIPQPITVTVTDVNEAPMIAAGQNRTFSIAENTAAGTAVRTITATDPEDDPLTFSITSGNVGNAFAINARSGEITVAGTIDHETTPTYNLTVQVSDGDLSATTTVTVNVTNVNDNDPMITSPAIASVAENTITVLTVMADDADAGTTLTYAISAGADSVQFRIGQSTGNLTFKTAPDFEGASANGNDDYEVIVRVSDGTNTDMQTITVTVTDENDNTPIITSPATVSVAESTTTVLTVMADDADAGTTLIYSITAGADSARFSINQSTGDLTFKTAPDFEGASADGNDDYEVIVTASDGTNTDMQTITVTVTDVNDNSPMITSPATASIAENTTDVLTVTATDEDAGTTLTYAITAGTDSARFSIDQSTRDLAFKTAPDFEGASADGDDDYEVIVTVSDGTNTDMQTITVTVTNVNDNDPMITSPATASIVEGTTTVLTVTATDADAGTTLFYSITAGTDSVRFSIDQSNGDLAFKTAPDFEAPGSADNSNVYEVEVTVSDGTNSDTQTITITVTDDPADNILSFSADEEATVIFPNPSGDYLEVRSSIGGTFKILSLSGKHLLEGTTNTRTEITSLQSGLYLVQLPDGRLLKFVRE